jgi:uncharacterized protein
MLPLATRLSDICLRSQALRHILEKDYVLSWILAGIANVKSLREYLVFKGGTCLKKCYFGEYRFSEDLDFSTTGEGPIGQHLESLMYQATEKANVLLSGAIGNAEIICSRYTERRPHPEGQEAFVLKARLPYQRDHLVRALVEVSTREKVIGAIEVKPILHSYGEAIKETIQCYSLNEIIAEKICAILSNTKKLHERSWHRSRARDYYDLWRIFKDFDQIIEKETLPQLIQDKALLKGVVFTTTQDLFQPDYIVTIKKTWKEWLGPLVPNLPNSDTVLSELRKFIEAQAF